MSETPELGDWHQHRRCSNCGGMYDARAASCYLCGEEPEKTPGAAAAQAHTTAMNAHLYGEGNAARRDHQATRNIPAGNLNGRVGPTGAAYRGARGYDALVKHIKSELRNAGVGE